jgi:hypothetical protein
MKSKATLAAAVIGTSVVNLLSACAGVDAGKPAGEAKGAPEYRTGSHIPIRSADPQTTPEDREKTLEQVRNLQRVGNPKLPQG